MKMNRRERERLCNAQPSPYEGGDPVCGGVEGGEKSFPRGQEEVGVVEGNRVAKNGMRGRAGASVFGWGSSQVLACHERLDAKVKRSAARCRAQAATRTGVYLGHERNSPGRRKGVGEGNG